MGQRELWDGFYRRNPRAWRGTSSIPAPCPGRALDVGCGNGKTVSALLDMGMEVTGIDFSPTALRRCSETYPDAEFVECDASELPFPDGSFDYVTAVHLLENLDDGKLRKAVSEIVRVVRPGGYVFVRCFTPEDMRSGDRADGFFYRYFRLDEVLGLFQGMETVDSATKEDATRFGTKRSRAECLLRKDYARTRSRRSPAMDKIPDGRGWV